MATRSQAEPPQRPFPLMEFPRELRNNIYQYLLEHHRVKAKLLESIPIAARGEVTDGVNITINSPTTDVLLVSRQFSKEITEAAQQNKSLRITSAFGWYSLDLAAIPSWITRGAKHVAFEDFVHDCGFPIPPEEHEEYLADVLEEFRDGLRASPAVFAEVGSISVTVFLKRDRKYVSDEFPLSGGDEFRLRGVLDELNARANVAEVELETFFMNGDEDGFCEGSWTLENGWIKRTGPLPDCNGSPSA